jgi:DNA-binding beta-propeller fold protein YncE
VAVDLHGNVYVSEAGTERVQKFDSHGRWLLQWGGPPATAGHGAFGNVIGVATDRVGNVYTDDDHAYETVQKFDNTGKFLKVVSAGKISDAGGIAVSRRGQLYAADFRAGVARYTTAGHFLGEFGSGPGRARLSAPIGLAVQMGDLFVADSGNSRIAEFTPSGKFVAEFTGTGRGKLTSPSALAIDAASHRLFVYDQGSARLLAFKLSG